MPVWHPSAPDRIETDLASLWRELAQAGPVSRALMSNVVVVAECPAGSEIAPVFERLPIAELARLHQARTIVVGYAAGVRECAAPKSAYVGVLTIGAGAARYGVELVAVHATCADRSIPSIVRAVAIGHLPTAIWWTGDLSRIKPSAATPAALIGMGRQLVFDSAAWQDVAQGAKTAADFFKTLGELDIADLNWRRLSTLRHAIVHALDSEPTAPDIVVSRVSIRHRGGCQPLAALLAGWFRSQAAWADVRVDVAAMEGSEDLIVELRSAASTITATMRPESVEIRSTSGAAPFTAAVPHETEPQALAAELRQLSQDAVLKSVLSTLAA